TWPEALVEAERHPRTAADPRIQTKAVHAARLRRARGRQPRPAVDAEEAPPDVEAVGRQRPLPFGVGAEGGAAPVPRTAQARNGLGPRHRRRLRLQAETVAAPFGEAVLLQSGVFATEIGVNLQRADTMPAPGLQRQRG